MINEVQAYLPKVLNREKTEEIKRFRGQPTHHIFSLTSVPNLVFKLGEDMADRCRNIALAREVCQNEGLDDLYIPKSAIFEVEYQGRSYTVLAEERLEVNLASQKEQYRSTSDKIQRIIRQLTIFICKTGFSDIEYRNIPLFTHEGRLKVALWDLEEMDSMQAGLFGFGAFRTGLMRCVDRSQVPDIVATVKECLAWSEEMELLLRRV